MLKLRVATALALLIVLLPLLFHDNATPFIAMALLMLSAGAWEWGRLNGLVAHAAMGLGVAFFAFVVCLWWVLGTSSFPTAVWLFGFVLWSVVVPWLLRRGVISWGEHSQGLRIVGGLAALVLAWMATAQARAIGINFLLSVLAMAWAADIAAYFAGKAFGRHKLAPTVSPGKSWEGAVAGWLGVMVLAIAWMWLDARAPSDSPSIYTRLFTQWPWACWAVFTALSVASVVGDLTESLVKRSAGFKDSSQLLPGHGGVLDRVDALLPVLPLSMFFVSL